MLRFYFLAIALLTLSFQSTIRDKKVHVMNFDQLNPFLEKKNDSVYLINFWATWCSPCREELPAIEKVSKKFSEKKFKVILVSLDMQGQLNSRLYPFIKKNNISSDVILLNDMNQNRWINLVNKDWEGDIPYTLIYGRNFRLFYNKMLRYDFLDSVLTSKLN